MLSCGYVSAIAVPPSQVALNMASDSHLLNDGLSLNCRNSSVWSERRSTTARPSALSLSEFSVGPVGRDPGRQFLGDDPADLVDVLPVDAAVYLVELLEGVAQQIDLGIRRSTRAVHRHGADNINA